ncbi:MAG: hypothetical protein AB9835_14095 [Eubacteriales bacterium]
MEYKQDWEETKQRYKQWWAGEYFGRCAMAVCAPRNGRADIKPPELPARVEDRWLDFDYLKAVNDYHMSRTFYGGEAFPRWTPGYPGWDFIPSYLGAEVKLKEDTGWVQPLMEKGALTDYDYRDFKINQDNKWWKFAKEVHKLAAAEAKGKSVPGIQAIGASGDTLACMRSSNQLLYDLIECPEYVAKFDYYLTQMWIEVYDTFYDIITKEAQGSTCWFDLWSPGKYYSIQNDFAYMISPKMFNEIFLPSIELQANYLDNVIYHVDGVGNFNHVDQLLHIPGIQAFQILPGAGKPSALYYMDVLKKVQAAGKNLYINIGPDEVKDALQSLSAKGLFIQTWCGSEEDARQLLKNAGQWSVV